MIKLRTKWNYNRNLFIFNILLVILIVTLENRKRLAEFDEKIKTAQREQKIIDAKSWEAARKIVLNS